MLRFVSKNETYKYRAEKTIEIKMRYTHIYLTVEKKGQFY